MTIINYIFLIIGCLIILIGALSIFFPGLTRIINAPGGPRVKSIIAIIVGIIILVVGLIANIPAN